MDGSDDGYGFDHMGRPQVAKWITTWLLDEKGLLTRARQIIAADERDGTVLFPWWVEFLLFGANRGTFNLDSEPVHDGHRVFELKSRIDRDDFRRIDWDAVRDALRQS